ncbi:MAG TPA: hypothetical protein VFU69_11965 [Ktedonobacterales bacterium]|nr:hypothetical protein [Ktedonobacterales bacterium]
MRLFDVYMAVDWSARSVPGPARPTHDALWVAEALAPEVDTAEHSGETYWRTRQACLAHLYARLRHHVNKGRRVLLGFDFCYGYPAGFAAALGLTEDAPPWRRIWDELISMIEDSPTNANNRFVVAAALNRRCAGPTLGPLWSRPVGGGTPLLPATSPRFPYQTKQGLMLEQFRKTERCGTGGQPVWKLYGSGSVGGQTLLGIPAICRLRDDPEFAAISRVWPFETGFTSTPLSGQRPGIIYAEIYPALVAHRLDPALPIRDQAQVRAMVRWLADLDAANRLSHLFMAPDGLFASALAACVAEEGWMLGAGMPLM